MTPTNQMEVLQETQGGKCIGLSDADMIFDLLNISKVALKLSLHLACNRNTTDKRTIETQTRKVTSADFSKTITSAQYLTGNLTDAKLVVFQSFLSQLPISVPPG